MIIALVKLVIHAIASSRETLLSFISLVIAATLAMEGIEKVSLFLFQLLMHSRFPDRACYHRGRPTVCHHIENVSGHLPGSRKQLRESSFKSVWTGRSQPMGQDGVTCASVLPSAKHIVILVVSLFYYEFSPVIWLLLVFSEQKVRIEQF